MSSQRRADCLFNDPIRNARPIQKRDQSLPLRIYLMLLGLPVLVVSIVVVRCAHFRLLLRLSNFLTKVPSVIFVRRTFLRRRAQEAVRAVDLLARALGPVKVNCLERSITVRFLLSQMGIVSRIRLGVQRKNQEFQAHAWVEIDKQDEIFSLVPEQANFEDRVHLRQPFLAFPETPF